MLRPGSRCPGTAGPGGGLRGLPVLRGLPGVPGWDHRCLVSPRCSAPEGQARLSLGCSLAPRGPPPVGVLPRSPWARAPLATPLAPQRRPLAPGAVQAASVQEQPLLKQNNLQKYRYSLCPRPGHGSCPRRGLSPPQSRSPPGPRAPGRSRPLAACAAPAGAGSPQPRPGAVGKQRPSPRPGSRGLRR